MRIWAFFIIMAFLFLALILIVPLKYKEQIIGEKLIPTNKTNETVVYTYSRSLSNILISKKAIKITLIKNMYVKFEKEITKEFEKEICTDIFSGKKCINPVENCEIIGPRCVYPSNPFERKCVRVKIICYKRKIPVYQFYLDLGGELMVNMISNITGCKVVVNNNTFYYSPCNFNLDLFFDKFNLKIIPESEGIIKELSIERKLPEGKFIREFYAPEEGEYKIIIAVQSGKVEVSLDGITKWYVQDVLVKKVTLDKGTHTLVIKPIGDYALIKDIKIEKI